MPITTQIHADPAVVTMTIKGVITVEELVQAYEAFMADPAFKPNLPVIWDLSALPLSKIPSSDIRRLPRALEHLMEKRGSGYKAALVTSRSADFHLLRMYLAILRLIGRIHFRIFKDRQTAISWVTEGA